jgi:hypothetical protein
MRGRISENDWKRIQQFAARPRHDRDPDLLVPEGERDAREEAAEASAD